jgi:hypothetical protein
MTLNGIFFTALYLIEAIFMRVGNPDQSLMFWYLPILFIGIISLVIGIPVLGLGIFRIRSQFRGNRFEETDNRPRIKNPRL